MKRIQPYPIAVALSFVFGILYVVCVGLHLVYPHSETWPMFRFWEMILLGFTWFTALGFMLGVIEIMFGGFYVAYTLVPFYNFFNKRFPETGSEAIMTKLRFKPIASAVTVFGVITYIICLLFDLIFPQWAMMDIWRMLLPGFEGMDFKSVAVGLVGIVVYCLYISSVFVPVYNFFQLKKFPEI
jgi:hypothetical protein